MKNSKLAQKTELTIPRHIAIIMDGNGRWAKQKGMLRTRGHYYGVQAVKKTVKAAYELGVRYLTLYAFSTENWKRPKQEIEDLFSLMQSFANQNLNQLHKDGVFIKVIGKKSGLSNSILKLVEKIETTTKDNHQFYLALAINYGGRDEIIRAIEKLMLNYDLTSCFSEGKQGNGFLQEEEFKKYLDTYDWPDPDLLIRTSGESRLSNFLIWQCAYTEFVFMDVFWPEFNQACLRQAIREYSGRKRRFGNID